MVYIAYRELYIPAYRFEIIERPDDVPYYAGDYLTIPLVKEVLDSIEKSRSSDEARILKGMPVPADDAVAVPETTVIEVSP